MIPPCESHSRPLRERTRLLLGLACCGEPGHQVAHQCPHGGHGDCGHRLDSRGDGQEPAHHDRDDSDHDGQNQTPSRRHGADQGDDALYGPNRQGDRHRRGDLGVGEDFPPHLVIVRQRER